MFHTLIRVALVAALTFTFGGRAQPALAQPDDTKQEPAKKKDDGSPEKSDADKSDADRKADAEKADKLSKEFNAKLGEWKEILKKMRVIKEKFTTAEEAEAKKLEGDWNDLLQKGRDLIPVLGDIGSQAYDAAPEQDLSLVRFLVKVLFDYVTHDQHERGLELAELLIKHDTEFSRVYSLAGVAAFSMDDFERAEKYLTKGKDEDVLSDEADGILPRIADYKEWWNQELEIRKKEAEAGDLPRVLLTTSKGEIEVELFENEAPQTVANFVSLVESNFYDGLTFHRVLQGFMAQGGCPDGNGRGGPKYNIYCECDPEEHPNFRRHFRGTLSMAHAGKNTGGSQFFVTFSPQWSLDEKHTAFGRVVRGMDVLAKIQRRNPTDENGLPIPDTKLPKPDSIVTAKVLHKRDHEYVPTKVED